MYKKPKKAKARKGTLLEDIKSEFSAKGILPLSEPIKIFYQSQKGAGSVILPRSNDVQLDRLIDSSVPSGFGKGHQNVQDPSYRNAREIVGKKLGLSAEYFETLKSICQDVSKIMGNGKAIRAELIKLNIYGPECFFKQHVDSPKGLAFGSLVVFLPSYFEGGVLMIEHEEESQQFDFSGKDYADKISWVAFYNDCVHQITEVKSGCRLTLSYNLFQQEDVSARSIIPNQKIVVKLQKSLSFGIQYIYECQHYYGNNALQFAKSDPLKILKGKDAQVWIAALMAKHDVNLNILIQNQKHDYQTNISTTSFYLGNPQKIKEIKAGTVDSENYGEQEQYSAFNIAVKNLELVKIEGDITYLNSLKPDSQKYVYAIDGYYGNDYSIGEKYCQLVIAIKVRAFQIK